MILIRITLALSLSFIQLTRLQETSSSAEASYVVVIGKNVSLTCHCKCHAPRNEEFRVSLLRGANKALEVCNGSFNSSYQPFNQSHLNCSGIPSKTNVTFHLWDLEEKNTDIYTCKMEIMYPPPYSFSFGNRMCIHVKEKRDCQSPTHLPWLIMEALVGFLAVYTFIVSVALFYCWQKIKKNRTLQSDYMNMTPRRANHKQYQPYAPTRVERLR